MRHHWILALALPAAAVAQPATFQILAPDSGAYDVSADGSTVVGWYRPDGQHGFRWTAAGGMQDLGPGIASGISADGSAVAGFSGDSFFRWTSAGRTTVPGSPANWARISGDGSTIVGGAGARWNIVTGASIIPGALATNDVNFDGSVVVGSVGVPGGVQPSRWTQETGIVPLGNIGGGINNGTATVVTADGATIFGAAEGPDGYDAVQWTQSAGLIALGVSGPLFSRLPFPRDATPDGAIIVGDLFGSGFVWRLGAGPRLISDVLIHDYGIDLHGFHIGAALGLSANGRVVVGVGYTPANVASGWRVDLPWSIPAPGSLTLIAVSGLAGARRRRFPYDPACRPTPNFSPPPAASPPPMTPSPVGR